MYLFLWNIIVLNIHEHRGPKEKIKRPLHILYLSGFWYFLLLISCCFLQIFLPSGPEPSALWGLWRQQVRRWWLFHACDLNPPYYHLHLPHTHTWPPGEFLFVDSESWENYEGYNCIRKNICFITFIENYCKDSSITYTLTWSKFTVAKDKYLSSVLKPQSTCYSLSM